MWLPVGGGEQVWVQVEGQGEDGLGCSVHQGQLRMAHQVEMLYPLFPEGVRSRGISGILRELAGESWDEKHLGAPRAGGKL